LLCAIDHAAASSFGFHHTRTNLTNTMRSSRIRTLQQVAATVALFALAANMHGQTAPAASTTASGDSEDVIVLPKYETNEIRGFSDQAISGKTPVAFTEFSKEKLIEQLGSRDIPLVLNSSPSFYATNDGGGAGDSRMNVRGFDQRNISIMINGVPTNDMENGWLYWSNWDGLGDVSRAIQMQRGLSNVTLPTPSIGGTMNIITDPAEMKRGVSIKTEVGYDEFLKGTVVASTGMLKDKFAFTICGVAKTGEESSSVRGTWTEGTAYYFGALYKINALNRLEFFAIGAPQRHGQRTFASNIAAYDVGYAREQGYSDADIAGAATKGPINETRDFNPNVNSVNPSYTGQQYWNDGLHSRKNSDSLNERENYFHKPQMNLNWYSTLSENLKLGTVFYYSGGVGGGSGNMSNGSGGLAYDASGAINWDRTIAANAGTVRSNGAAKTAGQSVGILRNSVNKQGQVGIVSKLSYQVTSAVKLTAGVDWRTYYADHFQEVRDLLGGDYYIATTSQDSDFWEPNKRLGLGDKVGYFYRSDVDWLGGFLQGQYDEGKWHAFAVYGASSNDYRYTDYFHKNSAGTAVIVDTDAYTGQQIKGGVRYSITDQLSVFTNAGWVSRAPIFTTAIDTFNSKLVKDADNETFSSIEGGTKWETQDRKFNVTGSFYYTQWRDRSSVSSAANSVSYRRGINADYAGIELEAAYAPVRWVRFDGAFSYAKWEYTSDGRVETYSDSSNTLISSGPLYIQDLKVGDAPQTQLAASVTFFPVRNLSIQIEGRWYDRYWSDYDPTTRNVSTDRGQPWQIPNYSVCDVHVNYKLPIKSDVFEISTFLHVFNVFDKVYVSDATDNSGFEGVPGAPTHSAQRAEVFFGAPLSANLGVKVTF
jgi:hypothetical protein